jgi:molybdate transport system substrate-binding protein
VRGIGRLVVLLGVAGLLTGVHVRAQAPLTVAAASDLQPVMSEMAARFEVATGQRVRFSYGSSGQFVSQIENGAPFDLFLSADESYVARLVASGHADGASVIQYATGRLAIWTRTDRRLDLSRGLAALADPRSGRVAIANPAHAPYGRAAVDALQRAGVYEQLRPRLVLGESVSQAAQFAQTGNADAAIVALSLTMSPAMQRVGTAVEIPAGAFSPIRQAGVVLLRSGNRNGARRFLAFLREPGGVALLRASGFLVGP